MSNPFEFAVALKPELSLVRAHVTGMVMGWEIQLAWRDTQPPHSRALILFHRSTSLAVVLDEMAEMILDSGSRPVPAMGDLAELTLDTGTMSEVAEALSAIQSEPLRNCLLDRIDAMGLGKQQPHVNERTRLMFEAMGKKKP